MRKACRNSINYVKYGGLPDNFSFLISHFSFFMLTFAPAFKQIEHWRDGRVVDYNGLENRRTERCRGFESLSLRQIAQMGTLRVPIFSI